MYCGFALQIIDERSISMKSNTDAQVLLSFQ